MEVTITCPLGSKCEEIKENKMHRCAWYTNVKGKDPQSEEVIDRWECAIAFMPMLQVEMSQTNRGQTSALCSFRDEMVKSNEQALALQKSLNG
jgi:hypothetical protein